MYTLSTNFSHLNFLYGGCGSPLTWHALPAQWNECAQLAVAEEKPSLNQHAEVDGSEDIGEEWVADAQVGSNSPAEIAC